MRFRAFLTFASVMAIVVASLATSASRVHAQQPVELDSNIQGTVGLGLVGAELGLVVPAIAGLEDAWAYIVFPVLGAGGGAVAGYFLLDEPGHTEAGVITLAAGMLLIVPTVVATLALTAYDPESDFDDDVQVPGDEDAVPAPSPEVEVEKEAGASSSAGAGLVRLGANGAVMIGAPGISVAPAYSLLEQRQFGAPATASVRVPVLSGAF